MGELYRQFIERDDLSIDKWHHYFPVYEQYLGPFVGKAPKLLEIGVQAGGSSRLFADWLGPGTHITGLDIDANCLNCAEPGRIDIVVGDQASRDVLRRLVASHGPWNIIVDDGGHTDRQVLTSFEELFPGLADNGIYLIEDTHAHWMEPSYRDHPQNLSVLDLVAQLFTEMHRGSASLALRDRWHTPPELRAGRAELPLLATHVAAVHLFDSMIVIEKRKRDEPFSEWRKAGVARQSRYRADGN